WASGLLTDLDASGASRNEGRAAPTPRRQPHGHDRATGLAQHLLGHAAQDHPLQPGVPVRTHDEDVAAGLLGGPQDFAGRFTLHQPMLDATGRILHLKPAEDVPQPFVVRTGLELCHDVAERSRRSGRRVDVQDDQARPLFAGQGTRELKSVARAVGKIGRVQDRSERGHDLPPRGRPGAVRGPGHAKWRSTSKALMTPTRTPLRATTNSRCTFSASMSSTTRRAGASGVTEKTTGVIRFRTGVASTASTWNSFGSTSPDCSVSSERW